MTEHTLCDPRPEQKVKGVFAVLMQILQRVYVPALYKHECLSCKYFQLLTVCNYLLCSALMHPPLY